MAIDGIIILDNNGRPIIQSGFRSSSTAYPLLHIDAFNNALQTVLQNDSTGSGRQDVDPVISVPPYGSGSSGGMAGTVAGAGGSACCHVQYGDMRFLCPVSGDVDPLTAFAFLQTFIDILCEYLAPSSSSSSGSRSLSAALIKENFDIIYQLFEETLDSGGHPLTTYSNALRDIVIPPSLLNKLLSLTVPGTNFNSTINSAFGDSAFGGRAGAFSSPLPWRKAGVRYTNNEVYFDIVESLQAVVNKNGTTVQSFVRGSIEANARLSGTPDCYLTFTNPHLLSDCSLHPCVRLQRWNRDKVLSFVPPDGRFVLMDYSYALGSPNTASTKPTAGSSDGIVANASASAASSVASSMASNRPHPLPFTISPSVQLEDNGGSFDVTLTSKLSTHALEGVVAELHLGRGVTPGNIRCSVSRGSGGGGFINRRSKPGLEEGGTGAAWSFDSKSMVLHWEIPIVPPSSSWSIHGSFSTGSTTPRPTHALVIRFDISSHTYSALKVDQLKVTNVEAPSHGGGAGKDSAAGNYKPYKGVRGRSQGVVEWRW